MIRSMTGFASIERQFEFGRLTWELRSVNHRYLEFSIRLPDEFRVLDPAIRECLGHHLSRGKIDITLRHQPASDGAAARLALDTDLARRLLKLHNQLGELDDNPQSADVSGLLRWPGMVTEQVADPEPLHRAALEMLAEAAQQLQAARQRKSSSARTTFQTSLPRH